ncbi:MAG: hypothetical protein AAFY50_06265 [Cyanobacteria bacterium J06648_1]
MTNAESKQQHEGANNPKRCLEQLRKNSETLAAIKTDILQLKKNSDVEKWLLAIIAVGVLVDLLSKPLYS